jgi:hypothetical protein
MSDDPHAPFGDKTIEGVFCNDVEYAFDSDIGGVTVQVDGRDEHEIGNCQLELERNEIGVKEMDGEHMPIMEMMYKLSVPVELAVRSGDDVLVHGFESIWTFNDVDVVSVTNDMTIVLTEHISHTYGETGEPEYEPNE